MRVKSKEIARQEVTGTPATAVQSSRNGEKGTGNSWLEQVPGAVGRAWRRPLA